MTAEFLRAVLELLPVQGAENVGAPQGVERVIARADAGATPPPAIDDEGPGFGNRVPNGDDCTMKTHERQQCRKGAIRGQRVDAEGAASTRCRGGRR